jgi:hypothetical protein
MSKTNLNVAASPKCTMASRREIREALHKIYDEAGDNPPNVERAWKLSKPLLPSARRDRVREVLREPEFACLRREPGRRGPVPRAQTITPGASDTSIEQPQPAEQETHGAVEKEDA